ncbi:MAG: signal peptidase I [Planctomycetota bacterium]|nr:signal peptidase I [Planctomycetota bacterium]
MNEPAQPRADAPSRSHTARDSGIAFLKDNLEAIAVAVVMALIIKHFCVEAFKIPTSSMYPTLMGESDNERGEGDRILVDKWSFLFTDPERFDVIVFRYPLNRARNFIKRIAFLPNEHGQISDDGDLWVRPAGDELGEADLRIPQKPRPIREHFYRAVYPPPPSSVPDDEDDPDNPFDSRNGRVEDFWRAGEGAANGWRLESHDRFAYEGGALARLRNRNNILEHTRPDSWGTSGNAGELVRDVRFRMRVRLPAAEVDAKSGKAAPTPPTRLSIRWRADGSYLAVMTLSSEEGGSEAFIRRDTGVVAQSALPVRLEAGRSYDVEMEYVDGRLYAHVDGVELVELKDGRRFPETRDDAGDQRFQLEAEGGALFVEAMHVDRDLRYENSWDANPGARRSGVTVPADSYFMLGDNTRNSSDSRRWRTVTQHLIGDRTIRYDYASSPDYLDSEYDADRTPKRVTDVDGLPRTWFEEDEDPERGSETSSAPFVHRDLIVGRAFLVFWPWNPEFPGRIGFIH